MKPDAVDLSVIFPAYNEAGALGAALEAAVAFIEARGLQAEIIVVDDGSTDGTADRARELAEGLPGVRVLSHAPNRGKGYAVREGMLNARGARRVFLDVDLATPVADIDALLKALDGGAAVALGSRHLPESRIEVPQGFRRRTMGRVFRWLARLILRLPVSDFTCGLKGFTADAADCLFAAQTEFGWAFDAELIHLTVKWDLPSAEVPVCWRDAGGSTVRPLRAARESLAALFRIRSRDRRGAYDDPTGHQA